MYNQCSISLKNKKGFTLIEIGIVLFVIGILITVFLPTFTQGIKDRASATSIITMSRNIIQSSIHLAQICNVPTTQVISAAGYSGLHIGGPGLYSDILADPIGFIDPAYQYCYAQSNIAARYKMSSTADNLIVEGTPYISFVRGGGGNVQVFTYNVRYETAIEIMKQLNIDPITHPLGAVNVYNIVISGYTYAFNDSGTGTVNFRMASTTI